MTMLVQTSNLGALIARAGASDKDRPAWLAQRAVGVTATEMRDLMLGTLRRSDLIAQKLGRVPVSFAGNSYTAWGNEREPVIAEAIRVRYGIEPESRLFRSLTNERFLCSPDGLGEDFGGQVVGSEIKTAGVNISVGTVDFDKKGYLFQIIWSMVVTGARRWLYAWEWRLGDPAHGFEPGEIRFEWIEWNDTIADIAAEMIAEAEAFLAELDAAAADAYVEPDIDDELDTHAVNYLRFLADEKAAGEAKKVEWAAMLERLDGCDEVRQVGATARVTYNPPVETESEVPDVEAAQAAAPELWRALEVVKQEWDAHQAKHTKTTTTAGRASLTVTAIKQTKENTP